MDKYIPQWIFEEVNKGIVVKKQYPEFQVNEFEHEYPFKEGGRSGVDKIGIMVSTVHKDKLFYEYYLLDLNLGDIKNKNKIIEILKNKIIERI